MSKLTGNIRYRTTWRGKMILQVEESLSASRYPDDTYEYTAWRDATVSDMVVTSVIGVIETELIDKV